MICNRCANELPSDTPVCRTCGPVTLDPGFAPLHPLPPIPVPPPVLVAPTFVPPAIPAAAPATGSRERPRTEVVPPPARPQPQRQSKAQRRRAAMSARTGGATPPTDEGAYQTPLAELPPPRPITLIVRFDVFVGLAELVAGWAMLTGRAASGGAGPLGLDRGLVFVLSGLSMLAAAAGLSLRQPFGWYAQLAILGGGLFWGSWSNVAGIAIAAYLLRRGVRPLFSGREAASLLPIEAGWVRKDTPSPALVPIAVTFLGLVAVLRLLRIFVTIDVS